MEQQHGENALEYRRCSYYSSSPSEEYDYTSDMDCEDDDDFDHYQLHRRESEVNYDTNNYSVTSPSSYPIRVNRTVAITVEVTPSVASGDPSPRRIRTSCYSTRDGLGSARVRAPVSAVGSPSRSSYHNNHYHHHNPHSRHRRRSSSSSSYSASETHLQPSSSENRHHHQHHHQHPQQYSERPARVPRENLPPMDPYPLNPRPPSIGSRYYDDFELYPPPSPPQQQASKRSSYAAAGG